MPARARSTRTYSAAHRKERARLLPHAIGTPCPICGHTMHEWQPLDLDHSTPVILGGTEVGDRITHATCNRSTGATLGNQLRGNRASQDW